MVVTQSREIQRSPRGIPPPRFLMSAIEALSRSKTLDTIGQTVGGAFARLVGAGKLKDLLSGTWLGHPLHPLLTDVPIGAWTSAVVFDVVDTERSRAAADALVGLGVLAAVPTAVTGLSDLTDVVDDPDRRIGSAHALGNVAATVLYAASFVARRRGNRVAGRILAELGISALTASGFLGGHLAYRRGLGVDQNVFERRIKKWTPVLDDSALADGKAQRVVVDGKAIMLYRNAGRISALSNRCSHRGGPLHEGSVEEGTVTCPWHESTFSLADGSVVRGPATAPQPVYEVRVSDGKIEVREAAKG